jgi:maltose-binding protein MalE
MARTFSIFAAAILAITPLATQAHASNDDVSYNATIQCPLISRNSRISIWVHAKNDIEAINEVVATIEKNSHYKNKGCEIIKLVRR